MSTIGNRLTVDQYDLMVTNGILPEVTYLELIEGRIVEKCRMTPPAACAAETCRELLNVIVPAGWYVPTAIPLSFIPVATQFDPPNAPKSTTMNAGCAEAESKTEKRTPRAAIVSISGLNSLHRLRNWFRNEHNRPRELLEERACFFIDFSPMVQFRQLN